MHQVDSIESLKINPVENKSINNCPILTARNLVIRPLSTNDAPAIFKLRSHPGINKFLGRQLCKSPTEASAFIENVISNNLYYWAITPKENDELIGAICLFNLSAELKKCEIGYELLPDFQGQGIMYTAAKKIADFSHTELGMKIIDAYTHKNNESSINMLRKLDFVPVVAADKENLILFRLEFT